MIYLFFILALIGYNQESSYQTQHRGVFESNQGYVINYPPNWWGERTESSSEWLQLFSSAPQAHGVGIAHGQARIIVHRISRDEARNLEFQKSQEFADNIQSIRLINDLNFGNCDTLKEIISEVEIGPNSFIISRNLICQIESNYILANLSYRVGDRNRIRYDAVVNDMVSSIRLR